MLNALIVIGCIAGYGVVAGITISILHDRLDRASRYTDPDMAIVPGLFWPLSLPAVIGVILVERIKARLLPRATIVKEQ